MDLPDKSALAAFIASYLLQFFPKDSISIKDTYYQPLLKTVTIIIKIKKDHQDLFVAPKKLEEDIKKCSHNILSPVTISTNGSEIQIIICNALEFFEKKSNLIPKNRNRTFILIVTLILLFFMIGYVTHHYSLWTL